MNLGNREDSLIFLQLITGKEESKDVRDLLKSFDLTICKSNLDGHAFRVADPHNTFNSKSSIENYRYMVVEAYFRAINESGMSPSDVMYEHLPDIFVHMPVRVVMWCEEIGVCACVRPVCF